MESLNYQEFTSKRVKERSIGDAYDRVLQWRYLFKNGIQENGTTKRVNLKEAADLVKVPKKTLEDYIQIFNKAELIINIEGILDKRMGFIRSLIKKNKSKIKKALVIQKQKKAEEKIKKREQSQNNQQNISVEQESVSTVIFESKNLFEIDCQQIEEVDEVEEWEYSNFILNKFTSKSLID